MRAQSLSVIGTSERIGFPATGDLHLVMHGHQFLGLVDSEDVPTDRQTQGVGMRVASTLSGRMDTRVLGSSRA